MNKKLTLPVFESPLALPPLALPPLALAIAIITIIVIIVASSSLVYAQQGGGGQGGGGGGGGGGNTTSSSLTTGTLPIATGIHSIGNSNESEVGGIFIVGTASGMALSATGGAQWSGTISSGTTVTVNPTYAFSLFLGNDNVYRCQLLSGALCFNFSGITGAVDLTSQVQNVLPTANGGVTPPSTNGDVLCAITSGTVWGLLAGNTSGTKYLSENASGVCSWATISGSGTVTSIATTSPLAGGTITSTGTLSLQNSTPANITALTGTDTLVPTNSGSFTNGDVVTGDALGGIHDGGTLLSALETTAAAQAAFSGHGVCTNQVATATVANAGPTCNTVTSAYVNNSIALTGTDINTSNQVTGISGTSIAGFTGLLKLSSGTPSAVSSNRVISFPYGTPGGSALSSGILGYITVPFACTITGWSIEVDAENGTITAKTLKVAAGTAIPTLGSNSISTSGVSLSTGTVVQSTTVTDFTTTTVTANDIIGLDVITMSSSNTGYINFQLICAQ